MQKAIVTRYYGPTETGPARIVASAEGVKSFVLKNPDGEAGHLLAAQGLCDRYKWKGSLTAGGMPDGRVVFVFTPALDALRALTRAVVNNDMPRTNPYSRPVVVQALTAIARHIDWHDDVLNVPLN